MYTLYSLQLLGVGSETLTEYLTMYKSPSEYPGLSQRRVFAQSINEKHAFA